MAEFDPIILAIKTEVDKTKADLDAVTAKLKEMGETSKKQTSPIGDLTGHLKSMLGGFVAIAGADKALDFLKESGKAAVEDAKSAALLEQQLRNTTGATKEQSAAVEDSIRSMSEQYGVLDDKIRPAYANLVRVTKDTGEATKLTDLAMNVAAGTGKDLTAVSQALAKAHEGQMGALTRLLPSVKGMKDPMGELSKQFAGAAATAANNDPYQRLTVTFDHIKESVGKALLPIIQQFASWLTKIAPIVEKFFESLNDPSTEAGKNFKQLKDIVGGFINLIFTNIETIKNVGLAILGINAAVKLVHGSMEAWKIGTAVVTGVQKLLAEQTIITTVATKAAAIAQAAFSLVLNMTPLGWLVTGLSLITAGLVWFFTQTKVGQEAWKNFSQTMVDVWNTIVGAVNTAINFIVNFVKQHWGMLLSLLIGPMGLAIQWIVEHWKEVTKFFTTMFKTIGDIFANAGKWLLDAGKNIIDGLLNGLKGAWDGVMNWLGDAGKNIVNGFKAMLGIKSPSTVFHEIGTNINQGLANGLYASTPWAVNAMQQMSAKVVGTAENMLNQVMDLQSKALGIAGGNGTLGALVYAYQQTGLGSASSLAAAQNAMANQTFVGGMDVTALIAQAQAAANSSTGGYQLYVNPTTGAVSRVQGGGISASDLNSMGLGASSGFVQVNLTAQTNATVASITQAVVDGIKYNAITGSALGGSI